MVLILVAAIAIAFLPSRQEAACEEAEWEAKKSWITAHSKLLLLHKRLVVAEAERQIATSADSFEANRWELWRVARDNAELAEEAAYMSPLRARMTAQTAAESCWAARDNTAPIPVRSLQGDAIEGSLAPRRRYRPGSTAVATCEEALTRSEEAWDRCSFRMADVLANQTNVLRGDYDFFGSGCL